MIGRREFNLGALASLGGASLPPRGWEVEPPGLLVGGCTLPGETRADDVVPAHPNGLQLSRDRWMVIYATRGFRGVDDDLSVVRQHGHPVVFGVPKGAVLGGRRLPNANVFVAKWRVVARLLDRSRNCLERTAVDAKLAAATQGVEWVQFRLNDREDDIEVLRPDGSERADANHFDRGRVAALRYRFDAGSGLYDWVETGPFLSHPELGLSEASLVRWKGAGVIAVRLEGGRGVGWARADDPFARLPAITIASDPAANAPLTAYACGDGALRPFTGDPVRPPRKNGRDPLYAWEIDPDAGFGASGRRVVFDSVEAGLPLRKAAQPRADMCQLLPPQGRRQRLLFRVSVRSFNHPYLGADGKPVGIPVITPEEKAACGIYSARIAYPEPAPPAWGFA
jgi:hypothetical protein